MCVKLVVFSFFAFLLEQKHDKSSSFWQCRIATLTWNVVVAMVHFPSLVNGLARTVSLKKEKSHGKDDDARKVVEALAKEAKKNEMLLKSSGIIKSVKVNNFACVFTKKGQKGVNQDCLIVWEVC